jgi:hypothetical protein
MSTLPFELMDMLDARRWTIAEKYDSHGADLRETVSTNTYGFLIP